MERSFMAQWTQLQQKLTGTQSGTGWTPNTDVFECPDGLVIRMEAAGVAPDAVEVHLEKQALLVRGTRRGPSGDQTKAGIRYRQMEIEYGAFERIIPLPFGVDGAAARAVMHDGFLEIRLPRTPITQPTRINIQAS